MKRSVSKLARGFALIPRSRFQRLYESLSRAAIRIAPRPLLAADFSIRSLESGRRSREIERSTETRAVLFR